MSIAALKWAFELPLQDVPAKAVLIALADHYSEQNECCWPSVERLQKFTGATRRTVQRAIGRLIKLGHVIRHERVGTSAIFELAIKGCHSDVGGASERRPTPVIVTPPVCQPDARTLIEPLPKPSWNQKQQERAASRVGSARGAQDIAKILTALAKQKAMQ